MFRAVEKGYAEAASILIQAGADVNITDYENRTPLHWAAIFGHLPALSLLLANGAELELKDSSGKSAMHCGAYNGHNEIVKYLIESGAEMNSYDAEDLSPCHWAAIMNHPHTLELLLQEGATPNATNDLLEIPTPLDYAQKIGNDECCAVLLQYGGRTISMMQHMAAVAVQKVWRGFKIRRLMMSQVKAQLLLYRKRREKAAVKIQEAFRKVRQSRPIQANQPNSQKSTYSLDSNASDSLRVSRHKSVLTRVKKPSPLVESKIASLSSPAKVHNSTMDSAELLYFAEYQTQPVERPHFDTDNYKSLVSSSNANTTSELQPSQDQKEREVTLKAYRKQLQAIEQYQTELAQLKSATEKKMNELSTGSGDSAPSPFTNQRRDFQPALLSPLLEQSLVFNSMDTASFNPTVEKYPTVEMSMTSEEIEYFRAQQHKRIEEDSAHNRL